MDKQKLLEDIKNINYVGKNTIDLYNEISRVVMNACKEDWHPAAGKRAYYLSMEFLIGRSFYNNLMELGILNEVKQILNSNGIDINIFEEIEDAALGNGGLGRLAACFLDSSAGMGYPLYGYGIRYRYGLFKQAINNGFQIEMPDDWQRFGDPWAERRENEKRIVHFADFDAIAVPYDMPVFGKTVNTLRLFQAEGSWQAEKISEYLYPADNNFDGKLLRLRQEYFFASASISELIDHYYNAHGADFSHFSDYNVIQLNDTHPVLAIPEFIRILTKSYNVSFDNAVKYASQTFNYTNHTILPEALECWSDEFMYRIIPEIADILRRINDMQRYQLQTLGCTEEEINKMAIYDGRNYSMANTAIYISKMVNGVAKIHTEILKNKIFATHYKYFPKKFNNKTNGITQRRWLMLCNSELAHFIDKRIGNEWREDISKLDLLNNVIDDKKVLKSFIKVKNEKKVQLAEYIWKKEGIRLLPNAIIYSQVKRLHEYKRQFMTALAILQIYYGIKDGSIKDFTPSVFIFGAKAAPSYFRAKAIIKLINEISKLIANDEEVKDKLQVVFVQNYNVSYAEKIIVGSDVSLQVSTAGYEASGTGNMKFMMNGAVTCGTMDGANIEIVNFAGKENNYIFGAEVEEIEKFKTEGYDPQTYIDAYPENKKVIDDLVNGKLIDENTGYFWDIFVAVTRGTSWHKADHYFMMRDLHEYKETLLKINKDYSKQEDFAKKQLINIATSSYFSSDRTITDYVKDIWKIKKAK